MKYLLIITTILLFNCSCANQTESEDKLETLSPIKELKEPTQEKSKALNEEITQSKTYIGTFFRIDYPANFTPMPDGPILADGNWIETDEATFTSPNGEVEFFVYSPQWGGEPKNYLTLKDNEVGVSQKLEYGNAAREMKTLYQTVKDKNNKYTRSYLSQKGESTHLVFGIKYKDQNAYDKYKKAYVKFKKSLQQFADN